MVIANYFQTKNSFNLCNKSLHKRLHLILLRNVSHCAEQNDDVLQKLEHSHRFIVAISISNASTFISLSVCIILLYWRYVLFSIVQQYLRTWGVCPWKCYPSIFVVHLAICKMRKAPTRIFRTIVVLGMLTRNDLSGLSLHFTYSATVRNTLSYLTNGETTRNKCNYEALEDGTICAEFTTLEIDLPPEDEREL